MSYQTLSAPTAFPYATPWGLADHLTPCTEGIVFCTTPSHGGFHVDEVRNAQIHPAFREADGWYEEDCAWAKVVYTFPEFFDEAELRVAITMLKRWYPAAWTAVTGVPAERD